MDRLKIIKIYSGGILAFLLSQTAFASIPPLSLERYLQQVRHSHCGLQAACQSALGAGQRLGEGRSVVAPKLFAEGQFLKNQYNPDWPSVPGNSSRLQSYQVGLTQTTPYGVQGRLYYNYQHQTFNGIPPLVAQTQTTTSSPILEVDLSLARNLAGRETRALMNLTDSNALLAHYSERYKARMINTQAEGLYWRLVIARQIVRIQEMALDRAITLDQWVARRVDQRLAETADRLQAQAGTQMRRLELQGALNDEVIAARNFNTLRGQESDCVIENLCSQYTQALHFIPGGPSLREDIRAAEQQRNIAIANAQLAIEKNKPDLNLYASYALNGNNPSSNEAISESFNTNYPTTAVGVRLSLPLDVTRAARVRSGYHHEICGAKKQFHQKLFENRRQWQDLTVRLNNARMRLDYAQSLEGIQLEKLRAERERQSYGKSTTYQVFLFQQDYANAQIARLLIQDEILQLMTQLKSYGV